MSRQDSPRSRYLEKIGLRADPFRTPVAEQEIDASDDIPRFYDYYFPHRAINQEDRASSWLREEKHQIVYGVPGSGKTTTRLNFELECRTVFDGTLVVTVQFGQDEADPLTIEDHATRIAQEAAIDLIIQVIEQIETKGLPFEEPQLELLRTQVLQGGPVLQRMLRGLAESACEKNDNQDPDYTGSRAGLGLYWARVGRYPVRYIEYSEPLKKLLDEILKPAGEQVRALAGLDALWQTVEAARAWGYRRIFVLVDGVDMRARSPEEMHRMVAPLIDHLNIFQKKNIFMKLFLPLEIKPQVEKQIDHIPGLNSIVLDATITWNQQMLRELLIQRFRAAGSETIESLDVFAGEDLKHGLEHPVIELAQGSPRRMLTIISELINAHIANRDERVKISQRDWNLMEKNTRRLLADSNH